MSKKSTTRKDSSDRGVAAQHIQESKIDPTIKDAYEPHKKADEPELHSQDQKHKEQYQGS